MRQAKCYYCGCVDTKSIPDSKQFWKAANRHPLTSSDITLTENGVLVSDDVKVAEIMYDYFLDITENLGSQRKQREYPLLLMTTKYRLTILRTF